MCINPSSAREGEAGQGAKRQAGSGVDAMRRTTGGAGLPKPNVSSGRRMPWRSSGRNSGLFTGQQPPWERRRRPARRGWRASGVVQRRQRAHKAAAAGPYSGGFREVVRPRVGSGRGCAAFFACIGASARCRAPSLRRTRLHGRLSEPSRSPMRPPPSGGAGRCP